MNDNDDKSPDVSQKAVALRYDREKENSPRIVAKGKGLIAEKIIEIARQHGVTIYEDKELIEILSRIEMYQVIPAELYQVIAEVLAFVYRMNKTAFRT
jgi:flagellar biosynthesis protein